jgi:hypothetical protein
MTRLASAFAKKYENDGKLIQKCAQAGGPRSYSLAVPDGRGGSALSIMIVRVGNGI